MVYKYENTARRVKRAVSLHEALPFWIFNGDELLPTCIPNDDAKISCRNRVMIINTGQTRILPFVETNSIKETDTWYVSESRTERKKFCAKRLFESTNPWSKSMPYAAWYNIGFCGYEIDLYVALSLLYSIVYMPMKCRK